MKLGILGDIHGNRFALRAVLSAASRHGVERLLITGDLVGYYFWRRDVLEMLSSWETHVVRGNHEEMLSMVQKKPDCLLPISEKYGDGLKIALDTLSCSQLDWLKNLPHPMSLELGGRRILLCHGAPWDLDCYIYPDSCVSMFEKCTEHGDDLVILGHSHYAYTAKCGNTMIVNPGSVGQPRDRKPGAHWVLLNTETMEVTHFAEKYNVFEVVEYAKAFQPSVPYLADVLCRK